MRSPRALLTAVVLAALFATALRSVPALAQSADAPAEALPAAPTDDATEAVTTPPAGPAAVEPVEHPRVPRGAPGALRPTPSREGPPRGAPATPLDAADETPAGNTTPRAAVLRFLDAARDRDWRTAADALLAPGRVVNQPEQLARELKVVLDRYLALEPATLSDHPEGRLDDGLAPHIEEIGRIPTPNGPHPVRLVRLSTGQWVFARDTVAHIDEWYDLLGNRWLREHLPAWLQATGPLDMAWWQWIGAALLLAAAYAAGRLAGAAVHVVLRAIAKRTAPAVDDQLIEALRHPRNLLATAALVLIGGAYLGLPARAERLGTRAVDVVLFLAVAWALVRTLDVATGAVRTSRYVAHHPTVVGLLPLGSTLVKIVVLAIWLLVMLQWFGLPVASIVASLGIGGLAVALAAKTTLENLLSAVTLAVDQPFRAGDFVKAEDVSGTVEAVGMRSTRIRTPDRTLVTLPNGKLADMKIESFSARDRMRLACVLSLAHATRTDQLREVLAGVRAALTAHPLIWQDDITVVLKQIGAYSLDVDVNAWFRTADAGEFGAIRQEMFLAFLEAIERAGTRLALPTQALRLDGAAAGAAQQVAPAAAAG